MDHIAVAAVGILAVSFMVAAGAKLVSTASFRQTLSQLLPSIPPRQTALITIFIPAFEFGLGLWILSGLHRPAALVTAILTLLAFSTALQWLHIHSPSAACHCFGDLLPHQWQQGAWAQVRNVALLLLAALGLNERAVLAPIALVAIVWIAVLAGWKRWAQHRPIGTPG